MIRKLNITDPLRACVPWWHKVKRFEGMSDLEFKPGLNILWGPNGSGKSTVIKAIATSTHCIQGGVQTVTQHSAREMFGGGTYAMKNGVRFEGYSDGVLPDHDGSPLAYFDPSNAVGLIGGQFDDDFFMQGVQNTMFNGSAGQTTMMRSDHVLGPILQGTAVPEPQWKVRGGEPGPDAPDPSDRWGLEQWEKSRLIQATLNGTGEPVGTPTILLDEPDRSLDIPLQHRFWTLMAMAGLRGHVQIIAASHSVFALDLPGAHYIEFEDGYLDKSLRSTKLFASQWSEELVELAATAKATAKKG